MRLQAVLGGSLLRCDERSGRAVRQPCRVPCGHTTACAERSPQGGEAFERRVGTEELVARGHCPAPVGEHGHWDDDLVHDAVVPGLPRLLLRRDRIGVCVLPRETWKRVVEVLRRLAHDGCGLVDDALRSEAGVEIDVSAHRVMAHVLDASDEHDVGSTHRDLPGTGGRRRERAGAHPIHGEPGNRLRQPCEERHVATQSQPLVTDLSGRGKHDVVDVVRRKHRAAPKELADELDDHVVGAGLPEQPVLPGTAECRTDPVHVDDLAERARHRRDDTSSHMPSWEERGERAVERYEDGAARIPDDPDERQRQLTRMGNTAWAAGLSLLMSGREDEGRAWLLRAADRYRESWASAPPASWGRPIGALKARLVAGDLDGAIEDATWALDAGGQPDRTLCRSPRAGGAVSRRRGSRGRREPPGRRRVSRAGRRCSRCARDARSRGLRSGCSSAPRGLRGPQGVPGRRARRGHGSRASGSRGVARHGRPAHVAAAPVPVGGGA